MDIKSLQERKKAIELQLQQKTSQLQGIENARSQLTAEVLELRGKLNLLNELLKEIPEDKPK